MNTNSETTQELPASSLHQRRDGEPPREVMSKLQQQLERIQRDIQAQHRLTTQKPVQRYQGSRYRAETRRPSDSRPFGNFGNPRELLTRPGPRSHPPVSVWTQHGAPLLQRGPWVGGEPRLSRQPAPRLGGWVPGDRPSLPPRARSYHGSTRPALSQDSYRQPWDGGFQPHFLPFTAIPPLPGNHFGNTSDAVQIITDTFGDKDKKYHKPNTNENFGLGDKKSGPWPTHIVDKKTVQSETEGTEAFNKSLSFTNSGAKQVKDLETATEKWNDPQFIDFDNCLTNATSADSFETRRQESEPYDLSGGSPYKKPRTSSGPMTPPGLKSFLAEDSAIQAGTDESLFKTLLASIKLNFSGRDRQNSVGEGERSLGSFVKTENKTEDESTTGSDVPSETKENKDEMKRKGDQTDQSHHITDASEHMCNTAREDLLNLSESTTKNQDQISTDHGQITTLQAREDNPEACTKQDLNNNQSGQQNLNRPTSPPANKSHETSHTSLSLLTEEATDRKTQIPILRRFDPPSCYPAYHKQPGIIYNLAPRDSNCPRCRQRMRWPHLLVCCHRFCFPCLTTMFDDAKNQIQCPYCRSITSVDKSLSSLAIDLRKCREMAQAQISPFFCTLCKEEKHAYALCESCPAYLCANCQERHREASDLVLHKVKSVNKISYNINGELHPTCSHHEGALLTQFCLVCSVMVCLLCVKMNHANHPVCELAAARYLAEERLRKINCGLVNMIELCQRKLQNFNLSKQKVEASIKVVRNNIHKTCNQVISYIDGFDKSARLTADKAHDAGVNYINKLMQNAIEKEKERKTLKAFMRRYVSSTSPADFVGALPLISISMERLQKFYTKPGSVDATLSVDLRFDPVYPELNEAMTRMFAGLRFEHNVSLEALMSSPLGERAVLEHAQLQPYDMALPFGSTVCINGFTLLSEEASSGSHSEGIPTDALHRFIRHTTPFTHMFGCYGRGAYEFAEPTGVCFLKNGTLAVCDARNHRVVTYDEGCRYITTVGQPSDLPPLPATGSSSAESDSTVMRTPGKLYFPFRLAQCPVTENLVILERPPSTDVQLFTTHGTFIRCFGRSCLRYPRGITVDESGQILIIESRTMRLFVFSGQGACLQSSYLSMHLEFPNDIAARGGNIFVSDNRTHCVHVYDYNLEWQRRIGDESLTYFPVGVTLSDMGQVVVADNHNTFNISVFSIDGTFVAGFKSEAKHAHCYSLAHHPHRPRLAISTKDCRIIIFDYDIAAGNVDTRSQ